MFPHKTASKPAPVGSPADRSTWSTPCGNRAQLAAAAAESGGAGCSPYAKSTMPASGRFALKSRMRPDAFALYATQMYRSVPTPNNAVPL